MRIYLPNGHLADGGVRAIWLETGLPYPTDENGGVIIIDDADLHGLYGYPKNHVDRLVISQRRPHNIARDVVECGGLGITGKDFLVDRLQSISRDGVEELFDLGCRPATLLAAFMKGKNVYNAADVRRVMEEAAGTRGSKGIIASEYPRMAMNAMIEIFGVDPELVEIWETAGQTETYPLSGDTDGIVEISETGIRLLASGLRGVKPEVIRPTTPRVIVRTDIYTAHEPVMREIVDRLEVGAAQYREKNPKAFKDKLPAEIFA